MPDWVADPDAARMSFTSAVFPAVDAPEKGVIDLLKDAVAALPTARSATS